MEFIFGVQLLGVVLALIGYAFSTLRTRLDHP